MENQYQPAIKRLEKEKLAGIKSALLSLEGCLPAVSFTNLGLSTLPPLAIVANMTAVCKGVTTKECLSNRRRIETCAIR